MKGEHLEALKKSKKSRNEILELCQTGHWAHRPTTTTMLVYEVSFRTSKLTISTLRKNYLEILDL